MKLLNITLAVAFLTASAAMAQGPLNDRITVKLPYTVSVNGTTLQPGDYEIRQFNSAGGGSRILQFFSDNGMKLETTAMSIPALDNRTPEDTKLVLSQYGSDYYLNKIWVQGKDYGYEFPIPNNVRSREKEMRASTVTAHYEAMPSSAASSTTNTTSQAELDGNVSQTKPAVAPAPVAVAETPVEVAQPRVEIAQNTPPPSQVIPGPGTDPTHVWLG